MKYVLVIIIVLHAVIHLLGFAKGFNLAALPQLQLPISRSSAMGWLCAAVLLLGAALGLSGTWRFWGVVALLGAVVSQVLIIGQFKDAKYGSVVNLLIVVPALISCLDLRVSSLHSTYRRSVRELIHATGGQTSPDVLPSDLAHLPAPVQRYLQRAGVVGKPRVRNVHVEGRIQMRRSPSESWMDSAMDQYSSFTDLRRSFFMVAHKGPISFDVYHEFSDGQAHMQAKILGLFPVVDEQGAQLTRSETVTVLNDMCLLAPSSLLDPRLSWEAIDDSKVAVWLEHAGNKVGAELYFNANAELVNFVSRDRFQSDGKKSVRLPWSTPVTGYRDFGGYHLVAAAQAQWEEPAGLWTYGRFSIERIAYNVTR